MKQFAFLLSLFLYFAPVVTQAAIVPVACDNPATCGTCEFVQTVNGVVNFIVTEAVPLLAVIAFIYAGFLLVISQGDTAQMTTAKKIFGNVALGILIILASYLIINTSLSILVGQGSSLIGWNSIECVYPRSAAQIQAQFQPGSSQSFFGSGSGGRIANEAFFANQGVCQQSFLNQYFGDQAATAACVAMGESSCGAYFYSTTDRGADGNSFSLSSFQINISVHDIQGCAQFGAVSDNLNCPQAFSGTNYSSRVTNPTLYQQCEDALMNKNCAAKNAARLQQRDGWSIWSAYSRNQCG